MTTVTIDAFDVAALKAKVPDGALELANFDDTSGQEAPASSKLVLAVIGGKTVITFDGKRGYGKFPGGAGAFIGPRCVPPGTYDLIVTRTTAKLVQNGVQKWKGKGLQKGLTGTGFVKW